MRRPVAQFTAVASARSLLRVAAKLIVLAALAASVPRGAAAQSAFGSISVGDRIRIGAEPLGITTHTGRVVAASEDTLVVQTTEDGFQMTLAIPRGQISHLEVSTGATRGRKDQFAGIGFAVGTGIGEYLHRNDTLGPAFSDGNGLIVALLLGGIGAGIGAYLGRSQERWRPVALGAPRVSLSLPQSGRGVGLRASMAF